MTHKFTIEKHQERMRAILAPKPSLAQSLVSRIKGKLPLRRINGNKV